MKWKNIGKLTQTHTLYLFIWNIYVTHSESMNRINRAILLGDNNVRTNNILHTSYYKNAWTLENQKQNIKKMLTLPHETQNDDINTFKQIITIKNNKMCIWMNEYTVLLLYVSYKWLFQHQPSIYAMFDLNEYFTVCLFQIADWEKFHFILSSV